MRIDEKHSICLSCWKHNDAQVCTRPDITFAVGMLGRYQSNPGMDHWKAAKKVLRYLKGTKDYMLMCDV